MDDPLFRLSPMLLWRLDLRDEARARCDALRASPPDRPLSDSTRAWMDRIEQAE